MKPTKETNKEDWTRQVWPGNPSLNLECSCKLFRNPFTGRLTPVFVFGGTEDYPTFNYCVSAGANSDYSYTGSLSFTDLINSEHAIDSLYIIKKLFK